MESYKVARMVRQEHYFAAASDEEAAVLAEALVYDRISVPGESWLDVNQPALATIVHVEYIEDESEKDGYRTEEHTLGERKLMEAEAGRE